MPIIFDGTLGITSPGGDTSNTSHTTPIVRSPSTLTLQTNGSTRAMTIDTSQNVLIGSELTSGSSKLMVSNTLNFTHINNGNSTVNGSVPWLATFNNANASSATFGWAFYDSNADGSLHLYKRNSSTTGDLVMRMDRNNGTVTIPSQVVFHAHNQSGFSQQSCPNEQTVLQFLQVALNVGSGYNNSNYRFTAPVSGRYYVYCQARFDNQNAYSRLYITKNGSTDVWIPGIHNISPNQSLQYFSMSVSGVLQLNAGDYIEARGGSSNGSGTHQGEGSFGAYLLG